VTVTFRPMSRDDFGLLATWLAAPHVERWWREDPSPEAIEARYGPTLDGGDPTELFIVEHDGAPVGMIQRYLNLDDPDWAGALGASGAPLDSAGIDYLIGHPALIGQGLGTDMIGRFVTDTWVRYTEIAAIVVTVSAENDRSWRALEKVGFERTWTGEIRSGDPSDEGISYCYVLGRPVSRPGPT
jgi:aminoglycoside 6'-N-acetyltransferase